MNTKSAGTFAVVLGLYLASEFLPTGPLSGAVVLGLFKGIIPKKEFRILFGINLLIILAGGVYTQVRAPMLYTTVFQTVYSLPNQLTNIQDTILGTPVKSNTTDPVSNNTESIGIFSWMKIFDGWKFPVNVILKFFGAGLTVLMVITSLVLLPIIIILAIGYYGSMYVTYLIYKFLIYTYLPGPFELVRALTTTSTYAFEIAQMLATWTIMYDLVISVGTIYITYFLLMRIEFYKRIPVGANTKG